MPTWWSRAFLRRGTVWLSHEQHGSLSNLDASSFRVDTWIDWILRQSQSCARSRQPEKLPFLFLLGDDVTLLRNVQPVQELQRSTLVCTYNMSRWQMYLPNILVPDSTNLLDICSTLWHILQRVSRQLKLILYVLRGLDVHAGMHGHPSNNLLPNEVSIAQATH